MNGEQMKPAAQTSAEKIAHAEAAFKSMNRADRRRWLRDAKRSIARQEKAHARDTT